MEERKIAGKLPAYNVAQALLVWNWVGRAGWASGLARECACRIATLPGSASSGGV